MNTGLFQEGKKGRDKGKETNGAWNKRVNCLKNGSISTSQTLMCLVKMQILIL